MLRVPRNYAKRYTFGKWNMPALYPLSLAELARATPTVGSKVDAPSFGEEDVSGLTSFSFAVAPSAKVRENNSASFSYAVSHGFGAVSAGEVKRGIPSYATILGQAKGDSNDAPATD
jgi:hypothetical protein